jgi:hypothetical protein
LAVPTCCATSLRRFLAYEIADWRKFQQAAERVRLNAGSAGEQYDAAVRQASAIDAQIFH